MSGETDTRGALNSAMPAMLEIRPQTSGFILFDTDAAEPIMRFDRHEDAAELVAELTIAEYHGKLQEWTRPASNSATAALILL